MVNGTLSVTLLLSMEINSHWNRGPSPTYVVSLQIPFPWLTLSGYFYGIPVFREPHIHAHLWLPVWTKNGSAVYSSWQKLIHIDPMLCHDCHLPQNALRQCEKSFLITLSLHFPAYLSQVKRRHRLNVFLTVKLIPVNIHVTRKLNRVEKKKDDVL